MNKMKPIKKNPTCPKCNGVHTYDIDPKFPNIPDIQLSIELEPPYTIGNSKYYCIDCDYTWKKYRGKKPYQKIYKIVAQASGFPGLFFK